MYRHISKEGKKPQFKKEKKLNSHGNLEHNEVKEKSILDTELHSRSRQTTESGCG